MPDEVLITGCSSGIGRCVAAGLHARGYRVFATARSPADVERLAAAGLEALQLDVADPLSIERALREILARTDGSLYALFNNAGFGQPGAVEDISRAALREQFETNVFGAHDLIARVLPVMRRQGRGRIIQHSSILGFVAMKYRGAYNASKYALEGLTDTLRLELHGTGIHVSLIEPGPVRSRFRENALRAFERHVDYRSSVHAATYAQLLKRLGAEGDVAMFTAPPEAVLKRVIHALESRRPRIRYPVTLPTYLFAALKRVLPQRALDALLRRV